MPSSWKDVELGDVITLQRGFDLPSQVRHLGPFPIVSSSGITGYHSEAKVKGPGVVTGRYGTIGEVFYVKGDYWPLNTTLFVKDFKGNDPLFVYYFLKTVDFKTHSSKSAVPGVNRNHIHALNVRIPPLPEQRAIARILRSLDDKIELNRKMNEILEAMAQALFKSWFVDFDPVHAKMGGREPVGMNCDTAALFPDSFEDSDIGPIPGGWVLDSIYQISDVRYGAPYASSLFNTTGDGYPLIRIRDLTTHNPITFTTECHPREVVIEPGHIVVGMDGEFRAHHWRGPVARLNQRMCSFVPKQGISSAFLKLVIELPLNDIEQSETATTVIHLGKSDIDKFQVILPSQDVMRAFSKVVDPLINVSVANSRENATLGDIRDKLIIKLLSDELPVSAFYSSDNDIVEAS